jgi:hypothetical protein
LVITMISQDPLFVNTVSKKAFLFLSHTIVFTINATRFLRTITKTFSDKRNAKNFFGKRFRRRRCVPKDTTPTLCAFGEFYCFAVIFGLRRVVFATRVRGRIEYHCKAKPPQYHFCGSKNIPLSKTAYHSKPSENAHL